MLKSLAFYCVSRTVLTGNLFCVWMTKKNEEYKASKQAKKSGHFYKRDSNDIFLLHLVGQWSIWKTQTSLLRFRQQEMRTQVTVQHCSIVLWHRHKLADLIFLLLSSSSSPTFLNCRSLAPLICLLKKNLKKTDRKSDRLFIQPLHLLDTFLLIALFDLCSF